MKKEDTLKAPPEGQIKSETKNEYILEGVAAEDVRVTNRALAQLKLNLSEIVIAENQLQEQSVQLDKKKDELLTDITKKSQELQAIINKAGTELGLNLNEGWKIDLDKVRLFR